MGMFAQRSYWRAILIALMALVVGAASLSAVRVAASPDRAFGADGVSGPIRLVVTPNRADQVVDGWIVEAGGQKQWIPASCRSRVQPIVGEPEVMNWHHGIKQMPKITPKLTCDEIVAMAGSSGAALATPAGFENIDVATDRVVLRWAPVDRATTYDVAIDGVGAMEGLTDPTATIAGLGIAATHTVSVTARAGNTSSEAGQTSVQTLTRLESVADLRAESVSANTMTITWSNEPDANRSGFDFYLDGTYVGYSRDPEVVSYTFSGLAADTAYELAVTPTGDKSLAWPNQPWGVYSEITASTEATAPTDPVPTGQGAAGGVGQLMFSDDFDGAALDPGKWESAWFSSTGYTKPVNNREDGCYHPSQVSVSDGSLELTAAPHSNPACVKKDGSPASYVSGLVNSRKTFNFTYGYSEARIWLPSDGGGLQNWPAFWTTGHDWPRTGEIDILEALSERQPCFSFHWGSRADHRHKKYCETMAEPGGWHTFAARWEPGKVTVFYDGVEVATHTEGITGNEHYVILNHGLNDEWGSNVPATMKVDYVRVWALPTP